MSDNLVVRYFSYETAPRCVACRKIMEQRSDRTEPSCGDCELRPLLHIVDALPACPECGAAWTVDHGYGVTLVGYFSPKGHNHDDNCRNWNFGCANGHTIKMRLINQCHCGWTGKDVCTICDRPGGYVVREIPNVAFKNLWLIGGARTAGNDHRIKGTTCASAMARKFVAKRATTGSRARLDINAYLPKTNASELNTIGSRRSSRLDTRTDQAVD